jgi:hypothetical protein
VDENNDAGTTARDEARADDDGANADAPAARQMTTRDVCMFLNNPTTQRFFSVSPLYPDVLDDADVPTWRCFFWTRHTTAGGRVAGWREGDPF